MVAPLPRPPEMFQSVAVTRPTAGSYVSGRWVPGSTGAVTVIASVQPDRARPDELLHLPEGDRAREGIRLYTDTHLYTSDEASGTPADLVEWQGEQWEVVRVESWPLHIGHYKVLALRIGRQ
jgi:hypothetical protein